MAAAAAFESQTMPVSYSSINNTTQSATRAPRAVTAGSATSLVLPQSATMQNLTAHGPGQKWSSRTWTTSSGGLGMVSDTDELDNRALFVQEYNRLAKKVRHSHVHDRGARLTGNLA